LNETFVVGTSVPAETKALVKCAHDSLMLAVAECKPGARYRELGDTITAHVKKCGFAVDRTYCGHGIGETFHQAPSIPHYAGNKAKGVMKAGHCFTIEPMINMVRRTRDRRWCLRARQPQLARSPSRLCPVPLRTRARAQPIGPRDCHVLRLAPLGASARAGRLARPALARRLDGGNDGRQAVGAV
jgi:hypothetical protein